MSRVAVVRCADYRKDRVERAVREALDAVGGVSQFIQKGTAVLVKPNLLLPSRPEEAICTHPEVVRAVVQLVREAGARVVVGDSPGFSSTVLAARRLGLADVCRETGAELVSFDRIHELENPSGTTCRRFALAHWAGEVDAIVSVAKLKTHGLMGFTGAVKNLFGLVPGMNKAQFHLRMKKREHFASMLVDLYCLMKPSLSIIDGVVAMEGAGPRSGRPREVGVIIASVDGVAADAVACAIIGLDPMEVPTTRIAHARGAGNGKLEDISIVGPPLEETRVQGFVQSPTAGGSGRLRRLLGDLLQNQLTARPVVDAEKCRGCAICRDHCPPGTIEILDGLARIREKDCIRCYCCHELCPEGAIGLQKGPIMRFLFHG